MMSRSGTFGRKLAAGFVVVLVLTLIMGCVSLVALRSVVEGKDRVIQHSGQDVIDAERIRAAMHREVVHIRGFLLTGNPRYLDKRTEATQEVDAIVEGIRARGLSPAGERLLAAVAVARHEYQESANSVIEHRRTNADLETTVALFEQRLTPKFEALSTAVRAFVSESEAARDVGRELASTVASRASQVLLGIGFVALLATTGIAFVLTSYLNREIGTSVQHIRNASTELQAAAAQQASGANEQSTAMSEITTTIGELLATSRQIAESGQHVAKMAARSSQGARSGEDAVNRARDAVRSIKQQVETIVEHMLNLGRKSQQIGGILEIINELSEQTNILAINATIEAAGAGEAGRRFAVVGEEIRKLADRVGGSTKEIRALIEEVRAAVNATVMATEAGSKTVLAGAERFQELQDSFLHIGEIVTSTMEAGKEIELSTKQQSTAVEQVNVAIANVAQATRETETSSQQTLQTASQLSSLSDGLSRLVQPQS